MSYALRNSLILIVVLLLLSGGGYLFIYLYQLPQIEDLQVQIERHQATYDEKNEIVEALPALEEQYQSSKEFIENFDKTLFKTNNPDRVYRFLTILSDTDPIEFNFTFVDSTSAERYGILDSEIAGSGRYTSVLNFITRIENSEPVQKVRDIVLVPVNESGEFNNVSFTFNLSSYYDKMNYFEPRNTPGISDRVSFSSHNPFFPLIRNVRPNTENLLNVENSQLVGIGNNVIYMVDQNGSMNTLKEGDRVYLGQLQTININEGYAKFRLNKGGIVEIVTLEVER